ncbi:protein spaetzle 3 [Trichonephila inaurata madagascariensis]|uniref:Protein spaetzle 3 n=1 Tax=Trichonephila inaurata madagascariensis TaxID=2747483 RepID=A0A8X6XJ78_9ARAC|nr:protein spaetzle 3 [Trichonephila inaurata madagascariensis]
MEFQSSFGLAFMELFDKFELPFSNYLGLFMREKRHFLKPGELSGALMVETAGKATLAIFALTLWLETCAEILRGYPCIRRKNQLYCPSPGNTYPKDRIEKFIDENKALVKRMVGEYSFGNEDDSNNTPAFKFDQFETYDGHPVHSRNKRARTAFGASPNKVDACESAVEIVTPYWASNSAGKIRAIVNTQHLQQAIQQEVCQAVQTKKCNGDCNCEQKYKWHRLLAYDPDDDCKGIFMDWFLFPSCCVCRCLSPIKQ